VFYFLFKIWVAGAVEIEIAVVSSPWVNVLVFISSIFLQANGAAGFLYLIPIYVANHLFQ
jgi:hypothetical protein